MKALKICLLGRPLIEWGGRQVDGFVSEKALTLFAYLVLEPGSQAREKLAGLFWGEMPPSRARANLRMAVYNLGQLFPGCFQTSRLRIAFDRASEYWLDVEQFERALSLQNGLDSLPPFSRRAREDSFNPFSGGAGVDTVPPFSREGRGDSSLENTLSLYRGDFLEGIYLDAAPELEEWLSLERERLRQLALGGFQLYASRLMDAGDYSRSTQAWRKLLRLEPWQETAHQGLMLALARSGDFTAALEQFETCRRLLADELGVEPMPETRQLYERIRLARDLPSRHNLPPQPTPFIGREKEREDLGEALANPQARLITLTGPGGAGKTRLALNAAERQVHAFLHGVWFISLESLSSSGALPAAIASALGLTFRGKTPPKAQLLQFLGERETLLVLDNFEHLLEGATLVAEILAKAPQVKILVTSRQRLSLREERLFRLSGLAYPEGDLEAEWEAYPAVQLFLDAGRRALNRFSPQEGERTAITRICRMVEGMPLAIEISAAWVDRCSVEEIAAAIETNLGALSSSLRNLPDRQRSLRAAFDHSWDLLGDQEKRLLSRLSVFRGGFTPQAAASIAGASAVTLDALLDKSLLQTVRLPDGFSRHRLHEVIRQFAGEKLVESGEEPLLWEKHLAYFLDFAEEAAPLLAQADQAAWLERIAWDHPNLLAALDRCASGEGDSQSALRLALALAPFWEIRGYFKEGLDRLRAFLDSAPRIPVELRAKALASSGRLAFLSGEFELSRSSYEASIRLCRESQNTPALLDSLNGLVAVLTDQGEYRQAAGFGEQALEQARQLGDRDQIALAANNLGLLGWHQGDYPAAHRYLEESLKLRRLEENRLGVGYALNNLALVILDEGRPGEAQRLLEESLSIRKAVGDRRGTAFVLSNLGITAEYQGDFQRAVSFFQESLAIRRELGDRHYLAHALHSLGAAVQTLGQYPEARGHYQEGLFLARRMEDPVMIALLSRGLGSLLSDTSDFELARPLLEEAVSLERSFGSGRSLGLALEKMGKLAYRMGDFQRSQAIFAEASELFTQIPYPRGVARAHCFLGKLCLQRQEALQAGEHLGTALEIAIRMGNPLETAVVLEAVAALAEQQGQAEIVLLLLSRASAMRESSGAPLALADQGAVERLLKRTRQKIPTSEFQGIWERGARLTDEQCKQLFETLK